MTRRNYLILAACGALASFAPVLAFADYEEFVAPPYAMWSEFQPDLSGKTGRFKNQGLYPVRIYIGPIAPTVRAKGERLAPGETMVAAVTISAGQKVFVSEGGVVFFREVGP